MIPTLLKKDAVKVGTGYGFLNRTIACNVIEERNGAYELTLVYPTIDVLDEYDQPIVKNLEVGNIIAAKPNHHSEVQLFRIYKITKPMQKSFTVYARHISYDLNGVPVPIFEAENVNAASAMQTAMNASPLPNNNFTFSQIGLSNNTVINTVPVSFRAFLGGIEGSVLDIYGGEYEFDNFSVKLSANRGQNRGVTIRYGKNLIDLTQEANISDLYTAVFPFAKKYNEDMTEEVVTYNDQVIDLGNSLDVGFSRALMLDLSEEFGENEAITPAAVGAKANQYIISHALTVPKINLTVSFYPNPVNNIAAFADLPLDEVRLCDIVTVEFEKLNITATAKVIKTDYDVLKERYNNITIGDAKSTFAETVYNQQNAIDDIVNKSIPGAIAKSNALTADRIIEKGTSGVWTYEKYESGKAQCWGRASMSGAINFTRAYGSLFAGTLVSGDGTTNASTTAQNYPAGLFIAAPLELPCGRVDGNLAVMTMVAAGYNSTAEHSGRYHLLRAVSSSTETNGYVELLAIGRWK